MADATIPFEMTAEIGSFLLAPVKKAEYIVSGAVDIEVALKSGEVLHPQEIRERVVRCRDCVHWRRPTDRERSRCTGAMAFVEPTPDGFCAWGKRGE